MKEKVIFDTNTIRNPEINKFLGNRKELELFVQDADIIIPLTVVEEIKRQKRTKLKSNKDSFISNPFHRLREINEEETKAFDIDAYIEKLIDEETISFEIIDIKNNDVLPLIKELAISKQPPFEPKDDTDKGFKDALIYFSVLEYLQEIPDKYVFLCAKDNRLGEAFKDNPNVIVVKDYEEFKQYSVSQFFDEYFIQKLKDELGFEINKNNIEEYWININENKVLLIQKDDEEYVVETDSGEIIKWAKKTEYKDSIQTLISSNSFNQTDASVEVLIPFLEYFNNEEIKSILNASWENSQIRWIIHKPRIKELIGPLFENKKEIIDDQSTLNFLMDNFK